MMKSKKERVNKRIIQVDGKKYGPRTVKKSAHAKVLLSFDEIVRLQDNKTIRKKIQGKLIRIRVLEKA